MSDVYPEYINGLLIERYESEQYSHHKKFYEKLIFDKSLKRAWIEICKGLAENAGDNRKEAQKPEVWKEQTHYWANRSFFSQLIAEIEDCMYWADSDEGRYIANKAFGDRVKELLIVSRSYQHQLDAMLRENPGLVHTCKSLHLDYSGYLRNNPLPTVLEPEPKEVPPVLISEKLKEIELELTEHKERRVRNQIFDNEKSYNAQRSAIAIRLCGYFEEKIKNPKAGVVASFATHLCGCPSIRKEIEGIWNSKNKNPTKKVPT